MLRNVSVAAAGLVLAISSPATAQSDTTERLAEKVKREFADCVVEKKPEKASEAILANADNHTIYEDYPDLISSRCLTAVKHNATSLRMTGDAFRYALAEALIRAEDILISIDQLKTAAPLDHIQMRDRAAYEEKLASAHTTEEKREVEDWYSIRKSIAYMSQFGECVVRGDAMNTGVLLETEPFSDDETMAISALQPSLAACVKKDRTIRLDRTSLRGTLAMNYYRLAHVTTEAAN